MDKKTGRKWKSHEELTLAQQILIEKHLMKYREDFKSKNEFKFMKDKFVTRVK